MLAHLLANGFRGQVQLIYIDPPFDSGADYLGKSNFVARRARRRLKESTTRSGEQIQYTDIWSNDNYLQFIYERLQLLHELLTRMAQSTCTAIAQEPPSQVPYR